MPSTWESRLADGWITGRLFDGQCSRGYPARLSRQGQRLLIEYGAEQRLEALLGEVRLGLRVGQAGCYLHLPAGAAFESAEGDALASLVRGAAGGGHWLRRLEGSYRLIIASALLVLLMISMGMIHGVPWASRHVAQALPAELERVMGENTLAALELRWLEPSTLDAVVQQRIQQAFAPHLAQFAERYPGQRLEVHFYASPVIGANALALPGGIIVFTDGLVRLAENDDELVAVLAHEVGHAVHRHGLRNVIQGSLALWLVVSMTGDLSAASDLLVSVPALLVSLNYSRAMEREADDFALQYLPVAGVQPAHFAHILQRLDERSQQPAWTLEKAARKLPDVLSSHPPAAGRMARFLEWQGAVGKP